MKRGFTLIELMVVVTILALLATTLLISMAQTRAKGRDARRLNDLRELRKALEFYYSDTGGYPSTIPPPPPWNNSCDEPTGWVPNFVPKYMPVLPRDPINSGNLCYKLRSQNGEYKLTAPMESSENLAKYAASDGGKDDKLYEVFSPGGRDWQP